MVKHFFFLLFLVTITVMTNCHDENELPFLPNGDVSGIGLYLEYLTGPYFPPDMQNVAANPVFKMNHAGNTSGSCNGQVYSIPRQCSVVCSDARNFGAESHTTSSEYDMYQNSAVSMGVKGNFGKYAGQANVKFSETCQIDIRNNIVFTSSRGNINLFTVTCFMDEFDDLFIKAMKNFPRRCTKDENMNLCINLGPAIFGTVYSTKYTIGGRMSQSSLMTYNSFKELQSQGIDASAQCTVGLKLSADISVSYNEKQYQMYQSKTTTSSVSTYGGGNSFEWAPWSESVTDQTNVVVSIDRVGMIGEIIANPLVNFPGMNMSERLILSEAYMNASILSLDAPPQCINDCSGHGTCNPGEYFNIGSCECYDNYHGIDCSIYQKPVSILSGTIISTNYWTTAVNKWGPFNSVYAFHTVPTIPPACPVGTTAVYMDMGMPVNPCDTNNCACDRHIHMVVCSLNQATYDTVPEGVLCGWETTNTAPALCNATRPMAQGCPGMSQTGVPSVMSVCYQPEVDAKTISSGSWCGMSLQGVAQTLCDGHEVHLACPNGYSQYSSIFEFYQPNDCSISYGSYGFTTCIRD